MATGRRLRYANEGGTLGSSLTNSDTTIEFAQAPGFATLSADEYIVLILDGDLTENGPEVVHLTTYTSTSTTGTIARGQEGSTAVSHSTGEDWDHGPTAQDWNELADGKNGGREELDTIASSGTSTDLDLINGNVFDVTLDDNCTFTFSSAASGVAVAFTLILRQDATGGRTVTWPASVDWHEGTAPTLTTTANNVAILTFLTVDAGTTWYGSLVGNEFA